jgi:hypothetical protein
MLDKLGGIVSGSAPAYATLYPNAELGATPLPHINPTFGDNLNQDAQFTGTPVVMYKENLGTGGGEYNASNIVGTNFNFDGVAQVYEGAKSIDATATINGDTMQLDNGSCPTCTAITGWIYLASWSVAASNSIKLFSWNVSGGAIQGNEVSLENYIDTGDLSHWQKFSIPLAAMGIDGSQSDAYRFRTENQGGASLSPNYYMDNIQLEEAGGGLEYETTFAQPPNTIYYACSLKVSYLGPLDVSQPIEATTIPNVDPLKYYHLPALENGLTQIIQSNGVLSAAVNFKDLISNGRLAETRFTVNTWDGTNAWIDINVDFCEPLTFDSTKGDFSKIIIQDDLSSIVRHHIYYGGNLRYLD